MKIAIVGATGLVGREMIKVLEEHRFKADEFIPVASDASAGRKVMFNGKECKVITLNEALKKRPDIALFSAGGAVSKSWAPEFAKAGTTVIDNSSAWRKNTEIPLIVPEINSDILRKEHKIISNPNCSTIQMVMAMDPIHRKYKVKRVVVSTYQSVTGSGAKGMLQLQNERQGIDSVKFYPHTIDLNLIPFGGEAGEEGYTTEEEKLGFETRKILRDESILVTATVVRVPVYGGHSEAVNLEMERPFELGDIRKMLENTPGIKVLDDFRKGIYPMPLLVQGMDEVFVGRIRRDKTLPNGLNLWVVSDNLRKGAATNAVQIAEYLLEKDLLNS